MGRLIDSSVLVTLERRGLPLEKLLSGAVDEPVALASITVSELLAAVHRANTPERRLRREAFVEGILELMPVLAFDLRVARLHAQLWAQLTASGQMIGAHDLMIGATAVAHGYTVLTENLRDFRRIPGLVVEQARWSPS